jgi:glycosyltransferase involved in cell wall biosynthesis
MKKKNITFSIITPVLNDTKIKNVFRCLKSQTFRNFEHIVVDGGSNKNMIKIFNKNKKNISNLIIEKDNGIYDAINKGIKSSRGKIIGILNSDDFYYPKTLELVNKYFVNKKIDYIFGSVLKERLMHGFSPKKIWYKFNVYPAHSCGFFYKKKIHKKLGLYDLNFKYSSDRDLIFRLINSDYKGISAKKMEVFGKFSPFGISSRVSFLREVIEEMGIRFKNQNFIIVLFVLIIKLLNKLINIIIKK